MIWPWLRMWHGDRAGSWACRPCVGHPRGAPPAARGSKIRRDHRAVAVDGESSALRARARGVPKQRVNQVLRSAHRSFAAEFKLSVHPLSQLSTRWILASGQRLSTASTVWLPVTWRSTERRSSRCRSSSTYTDPLSTRSHAFGPTRTRACSAVSVTFCAFSNAACD